MSDSAKAKPGRMMSSCRRLFLRAQRKTATGMQTQEKTMSIRMIDPAGSVASIFRGMRSAFCAVWGGCP